MRKFLIIVALIFTTNIVNAGWFSNWFSNESSLVGTYSIKERGQMKEFIHIKSQGGKYFLSEKQGGKWESSVRVVSIDKIYLKKILKKSINFEFTGLRNEYVSILHVPKYWSIGEFTSNTGFVLLSMWGFIELHKQ